ncbi:hypothetical protein [Caulobacter sp. RHG1]|uniref:hypothetical protein n=1 Tax=Caulobacter sp. (strain RHG1) TaxID=2545762 RepID=UPI001553A02F|nr:hypothetical protein [Caulobacter sp. RHG1]
MAFRLPKTVRQAMVAFATMLTMLVALQAQMDILSHGAELHITASAETHQLADPAADAREQPGLLLEVTPVPTVRVQASSEPQTAAPAPPGAHHHHTDGGSLYRVATDALTPSWKEAPITAFPLENDDRPGLGANPQDRPPRSLLERAA